MLYVICLVTAQQNCETNRACIFESFFSKFRVITYCKACSLPAPIDGKRTDVSLVGLAQGTRLRIAFDYRGLKMMGSVILTETAGSLVHSAPVRQDVNQVATGGMDQASLKVALRSLKDLNLQP